MSAKSKNLFAYGRACGVAVLVVALALALGCALSACGATKARAPEANIDPATLRAGDSNVDTKGALTDTDYWYAESDSEHPALYFQNNSIMTPVFLNADGTEKTARAGNPRSPMGIWCPTVRPIPRTISCSTTPLPVTTR